MHSDPKIYIIICCFWSSGHLLQYYACNSSALNFIFFLQYHPISFFTKTAENLKRYSFSSPTKPHKLVHKNDKK